MRHFFGDDFTQAFDQGTRDRNRHDLVIEITNDPSLTPDVLKRKGFRLKSSGVPEVWVHPTGKELWRLSPPRGVDSPAPPPAAAHPQVQASSPLIEEAQEQRTEFAGRFDDIIRRGRLLQGQENRPDYQAQIDKLVKDWDALQQEITTYVQEALPDMEDDLVAGEKPGIQKAEDQIKALSLVHGLDPNTPQGQDSQVLYGLPNFYETERDSTK